MKTKEDKKKILQRRIQYTVNHYVGAVSSDTCDDCDYGLSALSSVQADDG